MERTGSSDGSGNTRTSFRAAALRLALLGEFFRYFNSDSANTYRLPCHLSHTPLSCTRSRVATRLWGLATSTLAAWHKPEYAYPSFRPGRRCRCPGRKPKGQRSRLARFANSPVTKHSLVARRPRAGGGKHKRGQDANAAITDGTGTTAGNSKEAEDAARLHHAQNARRDGAGVQL